MDKPYSYQNQEHPPLPKKKRVDANGNDHRRLFLKDGNTTMLFVKGLTENGCKTLINSINSTLIALGKESIPRNKFLIVR